MVAAGLGQQGGVSIEGLGKTAARVLLEVGQKYTNPGDNVLSCS